MLWCIPTHKASEYWNKWDYFFEVRTNGNIAAPAHALAESCQKKIVLGFASDYGSDDCKNTDYDFLILPE